MRNKIIRLPRSRKSAEPSVIERASDLAVQGRRLAIYDKEMGLFSLWFIDMRCAEECYRSVRYKRPLTVVVLEPTSPEGSGQIIRDAATWILRERRRSDLPGYLGNDRIVMVMPETDVSGAHGVVARLLRSVSGLDAGVSAYPTDGGNFEQLKAAAIRQLPSEASARKAA